MKIEAPTSGIAVRATKPSGQSIPDRLEPVPASLMVVLSSGDDDLVPERDEPGITSFAIICRTSPAHCRVFGLPFLIVSIPAVLKKYIASFRFCINQICRSILLKLIRILVMSK